MKFDPERLKYLLNKYNYTVKQLANKINIDKSSVYKWLRGVHQPTKKHIKAIRGAWPRKVKLIPAIERGERGCIGCVANLPDDTFCLELILKTNNACYSTNGIFIEKDK